MPEALRLLLALALLGLLGCFPARGTDFRGGGSADSSSTVLGADGQLTSAHPGWDDPCCTSCHTPDSHNEGLAPHECAGCHGVNGAPRGHTTETPCAECHGQEHRCAAFPDPVSCQTCHQGTDGHGGDDDDDDDDDDEWDD